MPTTVYFGTNRVVAGSPNDWRNYGSSIVAPSAPTAMTYGTAFVANANLTADTTGAIESIQSISQGNFSADAVADLSAPGRNLLVFIHGFDNSFENAITRAAFNREWFAHSNIPAADTTVVAFAWPSLGRLLGFPVPWSDYTSDQTMAGQSGYHMMRFLANLQPIIQRARTSGSRVF